MSKLLDDDTTHGHAFDSTQESNLLFVYGLNAAALIYRPCVKSLEGRTSRTALKLIRDSRYIEQQWQDTNRLQLIK